MQPDTKPHPPAFPLRKTIANQTDSAAARGHPAAKIGYSRSEVGPVLQITRLLAGFTDAGYPSDMTAALGFIVPGYV
jgi:hypothetical protein